VGDGRQPQPYKTIGKAADEASTGNTIVVLAGSYNEQITINKELRIEAQGGPVRIGE